MNRMTWRVFSGVVAAGIMLVLLAGGLRRAWARPAGFPTEHEGHMAMTPLRPAQPGDKERAAEIVVQAKAAAELYRDYRKALADGYTIFHPEIKQHIYHFTQDAAALAAQFKFDASRPTSLLYEKDGSGYKLVGVMYTAPYRAPEAALNQRVPLSVAQWHLHTNLCLPESGNTADLNSKDAKFGLRGSITTAAACKQAGGMFMPHLFGWMVHVYPFESDPAKVWSAGMDDDEMDHDMMKGMKM